LAIAGEDKLFIPSNLRLFLFIGIFGGFTTFSTFTFETLMLLRNQQYALAVFYSLGQLATGLLAAIAGFWLAKML
jgi:fluoride exporter